MSWLEGGTGRVLRNDMSPHCGHKGVIFCTKCKEESCADRMTKVSGWKEISKSKYTPNKLRRRKS